MKKYYKEITTFSSLSLAALFLLGCVFVLVLVTTPFQLPAIPNDVDPKEILNGVFERGDFSLTFDSNGSVTGKGDGANLDIYLSIPSEKGVYGYDTSGFVKDNAALKSEEKQTLSEESEGSYTFNGEYTVYKSGNSICVDVLWKEVEGIIFPKEHQPRNRWFLFYNSWNGGYCINEDFYKVDTEKTDHPKHTYPKKTLGIPTLLNP